MKTISFINWRYMMDNKDKKDGCCCQRSHRTKERSEREYKDLVNRLSRIEGQVRGIRKMIDSDAYCTDILVQVSAVNAALNSFSKVLLSNHIHTCVVDDIRGGRDEAVDELVDLLKKLMK
jgi:DNA-binding FrmR family transcriptional regulator